MYDITVIGNAPVDILTHVNDEFLVMHNLKKGDFNPVDAATFNLIADECDFEGMESGGSTANTAWTMARLGKHVHFIGRVGDDPSGRHFYKDMEQAKITMPEPDSKARTMEIFVLITPDGERTFVSQGVSSPIKPEMIEERIFVKSNYILLEGFTLLDHFSAVNKAIKMALKNNCKIAYSISAPFIIQTCFDKIIHDVLPFCDVLLLNDSELSTFAELIDNINNLKLKEQTLEAFNNIEKIVTHSEKGATYICGTEETYVDTVTIENPMDATGAGDAFAAGFLLGYLESDIEKGMELGHKLASQVIQQLGGRIKDQDSLQKTLKIA